VSDVLQGHKFILRFVKQGRTDRHIAWLFHNLIQLNP